MLEVKLEYMTTGGCGVSHPVDIAADRRVRRGRAREASDRLVKRLGDELGAARAETARVQGLLGTRRGWDADPEVQRRVEAILPILAEVIGARRRGTAPVHTHLGKVLRNVAFHVFDVTMADLKGFSFRELNWVQRSRQGDKESGAPITESTLRADAAPFVPLDHDTLPAAGGWEVLPPFGCLCTCGAICFSSCSRRSVPPLPGPLRGMTALPTRPREQPSLGSHAPAVVEAHISEVEAQIQSWTLVGPSRRPFLQRVRARRGQVERERLLCDAAEGDPDPVTGLVYLQGEAALAAFARARCDAALLASREAKQAKRAAADGRAFVEEAYAELDGS